MADYPILFRISHVVRTSAFEARIIAEGRTLMTFEDDEWWCFGVEPGGIAESGEGPFPAFERFRSTFLEALDDLAADAATCAAFTEDAKALFSTDPGDAERWDRALGDIRSGAEIAEPFRNMEKIPARESRMIVKQLASYANASMTEALADETALADAA